MFPTFALLTIALLSLWLMPRALGPVAVAYGWTAPFALAIASGLGSGILQPLALAWILALVAAAAAFARGARLPSLRLAGGIALLLLGAGLLSHQLPGFNNVRVIAGARVTPDAIPYSLWLNFDKAAFGLVFVGLCHSRITRAVEWRAMLAAWAPVAAGLLALMTGLALASSYVRFEPKFPPHAWLWMWANLFLTCVGEEAMFRGFLQAELDRRWRHRFRGGAWLALGVAAVLFGVAHAAGGAAYVVLAAIAGVGYGWAYLRTGGRIEASILLHFALNSLHFFGFTYPALARV